MSYNFNNTNWFNGLPCTSWQSSGEWLPAACTTTTTTTLPFWQPNPNFVSIINSLYLARIGIYCMYIVCIFTVDSILKDMKSCL